jgi:preprotein translocase subunit SecG
MNNDTHHPHRPVQAPDGGQPYNQPVAYDQYGRPLYAHPPQNPQPQVVHVARHIEPMDQPVPPEIMAKHEESVRKYPHLNLTKGEYVISAIKRHPIGLVQIWGVVFVLILVFGASFGVLFTGGGASGLVESIGSEDSLTAGMGIMGSLFLLILLGGLLASYIYESNRFYLTNESVIQEIQFSLFSKHEQTVNLSNIEDASFKQHGILQHLLNYGTIRLSTEGDETTYRFTYVGRPKRHIAILNNAVEAFKTGRPVSPNQDQPS